MSDAELMDQFIDALRDNPQAEPPPDLEPETVTLLRAMQPPAPPPYVQAIVWQQIERALPPIKTPRLVYHLGLAAATLVLVLLAGWILRPREAAIISQMQPETPAEMRIEMAQNLGDIALLSERQVYAPQILPPEYQFNRGYVVNDGDMITQEYECANFRDVFTLQHATAPLFIQFPESAYTQRVKIGAVWGEFTRFAWTQEAIEQLTIGSAQNERLFIALPAAHQGEGQFLTWQKDDIYFILANIQSPWVNGYNACQLARSDMLTLAITTAAITAENMPPPTILLEPGFFAHTENATPPAVDDSHPLTLTEAQALVDIALPETPIANYYRFRNAYAEDGVVTLRYEYGNNNFPLIIRVEADSTAYPVPGYTPVQRQMLGAIEAEYASGYNSGIGSQWYPDQSWRMLRWQDGNYVIHLEISAEPHILTGDSFFALAAAISQEQE